jgi:hypothetical protein
MAKKSKPVKKKASPKRERPGELRDDAVDRVAGGGTLDGAVTQKGREG